MNFTVFLAVLLLPLFLLTYLCYAALNIVASKYVLIPGRIDYLITCSEYFLLFLLDCFSVWLISLSTIIFRSIHVATWEKAMAPHSSTVAWKIPWMEEPGRLHSMGSLRVRHDWATSLSLSTFTHWRRKWQPTPVFLPGESHGRRSLVSCSPWGRTESDMTEVT